MYEIQKFRQRLLNASRLAVEFKMSVTEARTLLNDIDEELNKAAKLNKPEPVEPIRDIVHPVAVQHIIMDGGGLNYPAAYSPPEFQLPPGTLINPL